MLDTKKLRDIIIKRLDELDKRAYNLNEFDQGQACAYDSMIYLIDDLEEEWETKNKKDCVCTCHTVRCDECLINNK